MSLRPVSMINKINKHANKKFYFAEVCFTSSCVGWLHRQHSIMKSERELNELLLPSQYRQNGNRNFFFFFSRRFPRPRLESLKRNRLENCKCKLQPRWAARHACRTASKQKGDWSYLDTESKSNTFRISDCVFCYLRHCLN